MSPRASGDGPNFDEDDAQHGAQARTTNWSNLIEVMKSRKSDTTLWAMRLLTLVFVFMYLFPIFGQPSSYYQKAFIAGMATFGMRLHQRVPQLSATRECFQKVFSEDSWHYLLYCFMFLYIGPITFALVPITIYAILHSAGFTLTLLNSMGINSVWIVRFLISIIEFRTVFLLRMAAVAEIVNILFVVAFSLAGRAPLLIPLIYSRFLSLRYNSHRNSYPRVMFREIKEYFLRVSHHPKCPRFLAVSVDLFIRCVERLA